MQQFNLAFSTLIIYITLKHVIAKNETPRILYRDKDNLRFYFFNTEETQSKSVLVLIDAINILLATVILLVISTYRVDSSEIEEKCDYTSIALSNVVPAFAGVSLFCGLRTILLIFIFVHLENKLKGKEALYDHSD